jgi:predicted metal-dependent phosphoesterase TrpH
MQGEFYNKSTQYANGSYSKMSHMLRVEFHCHTLASADSLTRPDDLVATARRKGIDHLIITDHNTIAGALEAQELDPKLIIVGEEIMTTRGELLASFVHEEIPAGLTPDEAIKRLKSQGAFISVSHPFDRLRSGAWQEAALLEILPFIDAIEVYNSRCMFPWFNSDARRFAERHNVPGTVGSDAHALFELGQSLLLLEQFEGPEQMRTVIRQGIPQVKWSPPWVHLASRYAANRNKLKSS